jgi:hypothetical protein
LKTKALQMIKYEQLCLNCLGWVAAYQLKELDILDRNSLPRAGYNVIDSICIVKDSMSHWWQLVTQPAFVMTFKKIFIITLFTSVACGRSDVIERHVITDLSSPKSLFYTIQRGNSIVHMLSEEK